MSQHKKTVMHLFFEGCWSELWRGRRITNVWAADLKYCCCSLPSIQILFLNSLPVWTLVLSEVWIKNHVSKTKSKSVILKPSVSQFWALQSCLTERLPGYTQVDPPTSDGNHSSTVSLPLRSAVIQTLLSKYSCHDKLRLSERGPLSCYNLSSLGSLLCSPQRSSVIIQKLYFYFFSLVHWVTEHCLGSPRQEKLRCQITLTWLLQWTSWEKLGKEQASF